MYKEILERKLSEKDVTLKAMTMSAKQPEVKSNSVENGKSRLKRTNEGLKRK